MKIKSLRSIRNAILYGGAVALIRSAQRAPFSLMLRVGAGTGFCAYYLLKRERRRVLSHLTLAFGDEKTPAERRRIARDVFVHLGKCAAELALYSRLDESALRRLVRVEGASILTRELEKGKGVILLTAHLGNWELMGMALYARGFTGAVVARRMNDPRFDRLLTSLRRAKGFRIIYRDGGAKAILKILRNNGMIGMLADQDIRKIDGIFVRFFGRPAYTPVAPAALARATGASLVPMRIIREGSGHRVVIEEPFSLRVTRDRERDLHYNTQLWTSRIEAYIREHPEQWVWMHRRWKTKPGKRPGTSPHGGGATR